MPQVKGKVFYSNPIIYLAILRIILVLIPQPSYLSPDEFIPNVETYAAKAFNLETNLKSSQQDNKYEEDMKNSPTLTVGFLFYGWSYQILWFLDYIASKTIGRSIVTAFSLLITPRLAMCFSSFLIDLSLYKIGVLCGRSFNSKLVVLSSSYMMLIYSSHTLTSTKEAILFSALLYFVADSLISSHIITKNHENMLRKETLKRSRKDIKKTPMHRKNTLDPVSQNVIPICALIVLGMFNRGTFLLLALTPCAYWLTRGIKHKLCNERCRACTVMKRSGALIGLLAIMTALMILVDSIVYGYFKIEDLFNGNLFKCDYFLAPFYKVMELVNSETMEFNMERQFGILMGSVFLIVNVLKLFPNFGVYNGSKRNKLTKSMTPSLRQSMLSFMNMVTLISTGLLMLIAQPTPVDFLPIILPFVYVTADHIMTSSSRPSSAQPEVNRSDPVTAGRRSGRHLLLLWLAVNFTLAICVGGIYEGGIIPAAMHLAEEHRIANGVFFHIVTSHVYPLSQMFFCQKTNLCRVLVENHGDAPLAIMIKRLKALQYEAYVAEDVHRIYLLLPGSQHVELITALSDTSALRVRLARPFAPHMGVRALPGFEAIAEMVRELGKNAIQCHNTLSLAPCLTFNLTEVVNTVFGKLHLNLYTIGT